MKEKIKNGLTFVAGVAAGVVTTIMAVAAICTYMPGGYADRFGTDVLKTEWPEPDEEDDDENE